MKRNFTFLIAAFALILCLAPSMVGWGQTSSIEINTSNSGVTGSYQDKEFDVNDITFKFTQWMKSTNIQAKKSTTNSLYNIDAIPGTITSIVFVQTGTARAITVYGGTSQKPTNQITSPTTGATMTFDFSGHDYNYFSMTTPGNACYFNSITIYYTPSSGTTYTVTYDCNGGESGCPSPSSISDITAGSSITLAAAPSKTGYDFMGWSDGTTTYAAGGSYTVNSNVTFTAQWQEQGVLVFDLTSNPNNWPTSNSTTLTDYIYPLGETNYTFALMNVKCNSGYLMMTAPAVLGLPARSGYKLTKVVAHNSSNCSTTTEVGISSSASSASYIAGGAIQTWSTQGSSYTYNLTSTEENTMYYLYVTNKNAQIVQLDLKYEAVAVNPAVATTTAINVPSGFNTDIHNGPSAGTLTATVSAEGNAISGATVTWSSSNTGVATINANGVVTLVAAGTTNITASYAGVENQYRPSSDLFELTVIDSYAPGCVNNPYTVAQACAAIDANSGVTGVYATGIVSENNYFSSNNGYITYFISDDGSTESDQLEAFHGMSFNGEAFTSADDIQVGDIVVIYGNLMKYHDNNTNTDVYEFASGNRLVSLQRPTYQYTLTVSTLSNVELFVFNAADQNNPLLEGEGTAQIYNGTSVLLSVDAEAGYLLESLMVDGVDVTNSIVDNAYTFTMPKHNVTITASAVVAPLYTVTLCDDQTALTELSYGAGVTLPSRTNSTYTFAGWSTVNVGAETTTAPATIIPAGSYQPTMDIVLYPVYTRTEGGSTTTEWHLVTDLSTVEAGVYALLTNENYAFNGTMKSGHGQATSSAFVFDVNDIATSSPSGTLEITIELVEGGFTMYAEGKGYLYAKGAGSGNLDWHNTESNYWYVNESFIYNKEYTVNNQPAYAHLRVYDNTFRTYQINSQHNIQLAKKVGGSGTTYYTSLLSTYSKTLFGYGVNYNPETDPNEHWYLIASPMVGGSNPMSVQRLINTAGYDLYAFDQTEELEWRNYKVNTFTLESGKGYLYANSEDGDITFVGTPYSGNGQVELIYSTANSDPRMRGMNLVGNPFPEDAAYIDRDFYTVNPNSNEFMVVSRAIEPMEGAIVKTSGTQNETMTFSTTSPANNSKKLALNLSQGHGILDRAIVHFEESQPLTKLQMRDNSTSICISMDGVDYASISADNQGEMPVSFKAEENGTYTLSFNAEDVELNYLHLFDNMTGNDVDLLANPSYTFEAKKTDYRSRFKLVFATGNNSNDDTFAFYSSGNWVINNEGEATLQVVDVTGRIVSSESINGCANVNINAANGVYMLRLVNGNNVKTQKIVVK